MLPLPQNLLLNLSMSNVVTYLFDVFMNFTNYILEAVVGSSHVISEQTPGKVSAVKITRYGVLLFFLLCFACSCYTITSQDFGSVFFEISYLFFLSMFISLLVLFIAIFAQK